MKRSLIELLYEAANIQRWNDHIRPMDFSELDKQAHKMAIAYVLGGFEEQAWGAGIDWLTLIEGGLFEFLHRLVLTDLKPPVFYELMRERGEELNKWVLEELKEVAELFQPPPPMSLFAKNSRPRKRSRKMTSERGEP